MGNVIVGLIYYGLLGFFGLYAILSLITGGARAIPAAAIFGLIAWAIWKIGKKYEYMESANYQTYAAKFPDHAADGRVSCCKCNSGNIGTEKLMNKWHYRRHFCRVCGVTLYYSPER